MLCQTLTQGPSFDPNFGPPLLWINCSNIFMIEMILKQLPHARICAEGFAYVITFNLLETQEEMENNSLFPDKETKAKTDQATCLGDCPGFDGCQRWCLYFSTSNTLSKIYFCSLTCHYIKHLNLKFMRLWEQRVF